MGVRNHRFTQVRLDGSTAVDLGDVEARCRNALRSNPENAFALYNLAVVRFARGDLAGSLDLASKCIQADPSFLKVHFQRGTVRYAMGDTDGALADFDQELRLCPNDVEALLSRAGALSRLGNPSDAIATYDKAIVEAPGDARAYVSRGRLRSDFDDDGALADFIAALKCDPCNAEAYLGRGFFLRKRDRKRAALTDFVMFLECGGAANQQAMLHANAWTHELERELGDDSLEAPLSELIASHVQQKDEGTYERFLEAFRFAPLGVNASGVPPGAPGKHFSTADGPFSLVGNNFQGRQFVLAFADPPAFRRNFGKKFNAVMTGEAVLHTALQSPASDGIRVNSAKAEVSLVIPRDVAARLLPTALASTATPPPSARPWWKIW